MIRAAMNRRISKLTVLLYLLQVLIPVGYMPSAFGAGDGLVQLCPEGMGPGSAVLFEANDFEASSAQLASDASHAHHHHHMHHGGSGDADLSAQHHAPQVHDPQFHDHSNHHASSTNCDYGALGSSSDEFSIPGVEAELTTFPQHHGHRLAILLSPRTTPRHVQARAPPQSLVI